jgi:hypothetical protein
VPPLLLSCPVTAVGGVQSGHAVLSVKMADWGVLCTQTCADLLAVTDSWDQVTI